MTEEDYRQDKTLSVKTDKQADESDDNKTDFLKSKLTEEDYGQDKTLSIKTDKQAEESDENRSGFPENQNLLRTTIGKTIHCLGRLMIIMTLNSHLIQLWLKKREKYNLEIMVKFVI